MRSPSTQARDNTCRPHLQGGTWQGPTIRMRKLGLWAEVTHPALCVAKGQSQVWKPGACRGSAFTGPGDRLAVLGAGKLLL